MFTMKFDTENDAFADGNAPAECARILRKIAAKIEGGEADGRFQTIFDINGNDVGRWKLDV